MAAWSDEETFKLIEIWSEDAIQRMFETSRRNKDIFVKISKEMEAAGYNHTSDQISSKIKKLKFEYCKIKTPIARFARRGHCGGSTKLWILS